MSRSCRRISFSRRSRFSSAVTSLSAAAGSTARRSRLRPTHRTSVDSPIPRSPAISRCVRPLVCARRTASSSNSFVNRRCCVIEFLIAHWELSTFPKQVHDGPPGEATHWSGRTMAKAAGVSHRSVQRIWAAHGLKPHRIRTFKLSKDPKFADKVQDIVGLYMDPPEHALVLSVDEKSQIQALDRTQPGLPMKPGRCQTMTHDYKRHGTTTLFAAFNVLDGKVIGQCMSRHRTRSSSDFSTGSTERPRQTWICI